jgi:hypothetical protein
VSAAWRLISTLFRAMDPSAFGRVAENFLDFGGPGIETSLDAAA